MRVKLRFPYSCLFPSPKQAADQTTPRYPCVMHAAVLQLAAPGAFFVFRGIAEWWMSTESNRAGINEV